MTMSCGSFSLKGNNKSVCVWEWENRAVLSSSSQVFLLPMFVGFFLGSVWLWFLKEWQVGKWFWTWHISMEQHKWEKVGGIEYFVAEKRGFWDTHGRVGLTFLFVVWWVLFWICHHFSFIITILHFILHKSLCMFVFSKFF